MFKFIHAADIHLDSPLLGLSRYESAPVESIRGACRRAFENLVDLAIEEQVAFVLLAGDLYNGDWKDYSTGIFLSRQMGRLDRHNILVFAVAGNHDAANKMTKALNSPSNMHILSAKKAETIVIEEVRTAIHGQSFATQHVDENLAMGFGPAERGLFNIGLVHTSLDGREGHANYAPCTLDDLRSKNYQYWALGHIHRQEFVSKDPWVVFPGCIQGRHIREAGVKGCVLVSVEDDAVAEVDNIALDVLRWVYCAIDLTDVGEVREILERTRKALDRERALAGDRPIAMRIRFHGATTMARRLAADPEWLEQQIKALGAETAGADLWIERVENGCTGKLDMDSALADDSAFAQLLQEILATPNSPNAITELQDRIAELRQKVPAEVFGPDSVVNLDNEQTLSRLAEEAKHMLIGRLLSGGGTQ